MKFAVLVYEPKAEFLNRQDPESSKPYWAAYEAYGAALAEAGVAAGGTALQPPDPTATTLSIRNGKRILHDGPYADTKEQLGGLFVIDVADLDAALSWAEKCPAAHTGAVEVRPVLEM